jgi:hypothetical protein
MATLKNQHFVPKCLFKPFSDGGEGHRICMYNTRHKKFIEHASISGQCARNYLYGKDGKLETQLSEIEGKYAGLVAKVIAEDALDADDWYTLRFFAYLQFRRTEQAISRMRTFYGNIAKGVCGDDKSEHPPMPSNHELMIQSLSICLDSRALLGDLKIRIIENKAREDFIISDDPAILTNRFYLQRLNKQDFGIANAAHCCSCRSHPSTI